MFTEFLITAAKIDFSMLGGKTSKLDAYDIKKINAFEKTTD